VVESTPSASPTAEPTVESPSPEPEVLDGTWELTACDLQLFTSGFDTSTLVAAVVVENTGTVPTVALKWDALPGPLFDGGEKVVIVNPGKSREVKFQKQIDGNDVDRVQSSTGYESADSSKLCKVKTSIDGA
jgi:hypothetical protein